LLDGLSKVPELVTRAKELGMDSMALTDHGVLYGTVEFYKAAKKAGIKPILGIEAYVAPRDRFSRDPGERYFHLILLCENTTGWKNLIKLSSASHLEGYYYKPRIDKDLLSAHHEGLIALSACLGGEVAQALLHDRFDEAKRIALEYQSIMGVGNYFLEIQKHPHIPDSEKIESLLIQLSRETGIPLVATQDSHYTHADDAQFQDVLLAVQTGNKTDDSGRLSMKEDDFSFASGQEMAEKFAHLPEALATTRVIADRCTAEIELGKILLPDFPKPDGKTANAYLKELIEERIRRRYPTSSDHPDVRERVDYEFGVIEKTGYSDYFLIVQDLINWAKQHGISVGPGRGSAAGSIIAYILGITDIDPLKYDLLFERFLNPERIQMPDIDIDFADTRRDEVLAYAREKYGADHVAAIITFGTMAARAAIRDAGRAMGMSYGFCDTIAKLIPLNPTQGMKEGWLDQSLETVSQLKTLYETDPNAKKLIDTARHLEGVARHASVHACGTVISKDPLTDTVPIQLSPQDKNIIVTQIEMHGIEDLGLLKIDFLGLRNLTIIQETLRLVRETRGEIIDISTIPLDDPQAFEILQKGDTTGVFQFESSGMRRYMKELKPTVLEDIIAMVALYRPGPLEAGEVPRFINRKHGREPIVYLHPKLEPILKNTYGVGTYQEQMMRIARDLAGYTLAEADLLRKAIGKKIKSLLDEQHDKLVRGMMANGIDKKTAESIWDMFPSFARYGFNKSHAACYALIGYQTAYLKAHYRGEFMAALFNAELSDIERISFLISEAKQSHVAILPPDINTSSVYFTPEGSGLRFGLLAIKNVGEEIAKAIVAERDRGGPFRDFADVVARIHHKDFNKKSIESMAKTGVFDSLGIDRNTIIGNIEEINRHASAIKKNIETARTNLFGGAITSTPGLTLSSVSPAHTQQKLAWEKELLGFYLSDHPLNALQEKLKKYAITPLQ
jgi:DNA polymerase-3 subunit alpha